MLNINIDVPDSLLLKWDVSKDIVRKNIQKFLAIKLFESDILTTGQAAEMCGMNRIDFMMEVSNLGIPVVTWDKDEIKRELENALKQC